MCIQCHGFLSDETVLKQLKQTTPSDFPKYNATSVAHIIYSCIGINGEECQKLAKDLLSKYQNWYNSRLHRPIFAFDREFDAYMYKVFVFCPNSKKFNDMCNAIIAYNDEEGRSPEFKKTFLNTGEATGNEPQFPAISALMKTVDVGLKQDPENIKPLFPVTVFTAQAIGGFLVGMGILMIAKGIYMITHN